MLIFTKIADLQGFLHSQRILHKIIGFVPTMGALHAGHLSLLAEAKAGSDITVCSIFVNPKQFNDPADLARYPRTPAADLSLLEKASCDVVFMPEVEEIYPQTEVKNEDAGKFADVLEGKHRPGHFAGVALVVRKFFEIIQPEKAYFGSKDHQQLLVIKEMTDNHRLNTTIVACPTVRENDGLAMSSRNSLLSAEERSAAASIFKLLLQAREIACTTGIPEAKRMIEAGIADEKLMKLEYFEIVDAETLQPIENCNNAIALIAVYAGKVRLIDNLRF